MAESSLLMLNILIKKISKLTELRELTERKSYLE